MSPTSCLLPVALASASVAAQSPQVELLAPDAVPYAAFGATVALSEGELWVGAPGWIDPSSGNERGEVYRFGSGGLVDDQRPAGVLGTVTRHRSPDGTPSRRHVRPTPSAQMIPIPQAPETEIPTLLGR